MKILTIGLAVFAISLGITSYRQYERAEFWKAEFNRANDVSSSALDDLVRVGVQQKELYELSKEKLRLEMGNDCLKQLLSKEEELLKKDKETLGLAKLLRRLMDTSLEAEKIISSYCLKHYDNKGNYINK